MLLSNVNQRPCNKLEASISLVSLSQVGRAGRDGSEGRCHLFLDDADFVRLRSLAGSSSAEPRAVAAFVRLVFETAAGGATGNTDAMVCLISVGCIGYQCSCRVRETRSGAGSEAHSLACVHYQLWRCWFWDGERFAADQEGAQPFSCVSDHPADQSSVFYQLTQVASSAPSAPAARLARKRQQHQQCSRRARCSAL